MSAMKSQSVPRCVVFDVETTGLLVWRNDRIIEIGAVVVMGSDR